MTDADCRGGSEADAPTRAGRRTRRPVRSSTPTTPASKSSSARRASARPRRSPRLPRRNARPAPSRSVSWRPTPFAPARSNSCAATPAILGAPFRIARTTDELEQALGQTRQTVLVDTAGRSPADPELSTLFDLLARKRGVRTHLVLAADTSPAAARRIFDRYAAAQAVARRHHQARRNRVGQAAARRRARARPARVVSGRRPARARGPRARDAGVARGRAARRDREGGTRVADRRCASGPPATRIAVTSGKGGVGKTSLTINLAVAMARLGHRVGVLDADFALGNIDVMLGLTPEHHLGAVLDGVEDDRRRSRSTGRPACASFPPAAACARSRRSTMRSGAGSSEAVDEAGRELDFLLLRHGHRHRRQRARRARPCRLRARRHVLRPGGGRRRLRRHQARARRPTGRSPIGVVVNSDARRRRRRVSCSARSRWRPIGSSAGRFATTDTSLEDRVGRKTPSSRRSPFVGGEAGGPASRCIRRLACRLAAARPLDPRAVAGSRSSVMPDRAPLSRWRRPSCA